MTEEKIVTAAAWKMSKVPVVSTLRPYAIRELCRLYGVSDKTMRKWLTPLKEEIGQRQGHLYNVRQIRLIFEKLGVPAKIE